MTKNITDDIPGWGALFNGRAGDGTVSVSISLTHYVITFSQFAPLNAFINTQIEYEYNTCYVSNTC